MKKIKRQSMFYIKEENLNFISKIAEELDLKKSNVLDMLISDIRAKYTVEDIVYIKSKAFYDASLKF